MDKGQETTIANVWCNGDPSVGIFPWSTDIDLCVFLDDENTYDKKDIDIVRKDLGKFFEELWAHGPVVVTFSFEDDFD